MLNSSSNSIKVGKPTDIESLLQDNLLQDKKSGTPEGKKKKRKEKKGRDTSSWRDVTNVSWSSRNRVGWVFYNCFHFVGKATDSFWIFSSWAISDIRRKCVLKQRSSVRESSYSSIADRTMLTKSWCSRKFLLQHCRQDDADERLMCYLLSGRHATLPGASCKLQAFHTITATNKYCVLYNPTVSQVSDLVLFQDRINVTLISCTSSTTNCSAPHSQQLVAKGDGHTRNANKGSVLQVWLCHRNEEGGSGERCELSEWHSQGTNLASYLPADSIDVRSPREGAVNNHPKQTCFTDKIQFRSP